MSEDFASSNLIHEILCEAVEGQKRERDRVRGKEGENRRKRQEVKQLSS